MILGCLFAILAIGAPRVVLVLMWLARSARVDAAFGGFLLPCLGFVFLPYHVDVCIDVPDQWGIRLGLPDPRRVAGHRQPGQQRLRQQEPDSRHEQGRRPDCVSAQNLSRRCNRSAVIAYLA